MLKPIYFWMNVFKWGAISIAAFLLIAAILQVGNTIRLAAFARRREIGIMRLVGASSLYIQLPFLMETLVAALIGVALAAGALLLFMYFGHLPHAAADLDDRRVGRLGRRRVTRSQRSQRSGLALTLIPTLVHDPQIPQSLIARGYRRSALLPHQKHLRQTGGSLLPPRRARADDRLLLACGLLLAGLSPVTAEMAAGQPHHKHHRTGHHKGHGLKHKKHQVEKKIRGAHEDLDESSSQLRHAAAALRGAQSRLRAARGTSPTPATS